MRAIILAAGRGSRMNRLTEDRPKCLIELNGKTLLDRQIASLNQAGIDQIGIVVGYKGDLINPKDILKFYNKRWNETNMVASLLCASEWLSEQTCIVCYSDIFYRKSAIGALIDCEEDLAITYDPNWQKLWEKRFDDPLEDAETFRLKSGDFLCEIGKKPSSLTEIEGQYMGLLRITPKGWSEFKRIGQNLNFERLDTIHMTDMLQLIVDQGSINIKALPYLEDWAEFDSPSDLIHLPRTVENIV